MKMASSTVKTRDICPRGSLRHELMMAFVMRLAVMVLMKTQARSNVRICAVPQLKNSDESTRRKIESNRR